MANTQTYATQDWVRSLYGDSIADTLNDYPTTQDLKQAVDDAVSKCAKS